MKNIIFITLGRLITVGLSVVSLRIITELLDPAEYGFYAILVVFQVFCGLFFINPFGQFLNRNTHAWHDGGCLINKLLSYNHYIFIFSVMGALGALVWALITAGTHSPYLAALAIFSIVYTGTWNATLVPLLNMLEYRKSAVVCGVLTSCTGLFFSFTLVKLYGSAYAWLFGQSIAFLLGAIIAFVIYHSRSSNVTKAMECKERFISGHDLKYYVGPLACATILLWFQSAGYRFIIERLYGLESLGLLAVGFGLSNQLFGVAESLLMQILNPVFYRRISAATFDQGRLVLCDLISLLLPVYFLLASALIVCASPFLTLLVSVKYHNAIFFFFSGVIIELFRVMASLISSAAQLDMKMSRLISPNFISSAAIALVLFISFRYELSLGQVAAMLPVAGFCGVLASAIKMRKYLLLNVLNGRVLISFLLFSSAIGAVFVNDGPLVVANGINLAIFIVCLCFALSCALIFLLFKGYKPFLSLCCTK